MPTLNEIAKFLVKKCQQKALDMKSVHVRVSGNNNSMELQTRDIK